MSSDVLAKPVIELSLDDIKFRDTWEKAVQDSIRFGKAVESAFKGVANTGVAKATISMKDFYKATESSTDKAGKLLTRLRDINKMAKFRETPLPKAFDFAAMGNAAAAGTGNVIGKGIGLAGAAAGLTFAGAAAGGSTTLDTLTGSFKMLALTIGEKVQPAILKFADWIQNISKKIERTPGIGPGTGALAAGVATFGVTKNPFLAGGAAIATGAGMAAADLSEKREQAIERLRTDPNYLLQQIKKATLEEKETGKPETFIRGMIREAEKRNREGFKGDEAGLRAGLGMPAKYTAFADIRQEAQLAGFDKGQLEILNAIKEFHNNVKAMGNKQNTPEVPNEIKNKLAPG